MTRLLSFTPSTSFLQVISTQLPHDPLNYLTKRIRLSRLFFVGYFPPSDSCLTKGIHLSRPDTFSFRTAGSRKVLVYLDPCLRSSLRSISFRLLQLVCLSIETLVCETAHFLRRANDCQRAASSCS